MGMDRMASRNQERQDLRLLLFMQLRPADAVDHSDLARLARDRTAKESEEFAEKELRYKPGSTVIVPATATVERTMVGGITVEGIGPVTGYSTLAYQVTSDGFKLTIRGVRGPNINGIVTFND